MFTKMSKKLTLKKTGTKTTAISNQRLWQFTKVSVLK